jgi:electron transfer flavoprotein alpha subunit
MSILVYIEHDEGTVKKSSLEAISYAHQLAQNQGEGDVAVIALGSVNESEWRAVGAAGASRVFHATDTRLDVGIIQAHAAVVAQTFEKSGAQIVVLAKSSLGVAVASGLSV